MNRDELEGKAKALKGKIKQATGDVTNNPRLHHEGAVDEVAGKAQGAGVASGAKSQTSSKTSATR